MKKIIVVLLLVCLSTSVFAKKVSMIQGTVMMSERNREYVDNFSSSEYLDDYYMAGLTLSRYKGGFLGWYSSFTLMTVLEEYDWEQSNIYPSYTDEYEGTDTLPETDLAIAGDIFFGPAMFIDLFLPGLIVGAGLHTNIMHLDYTIEDYDDYTSAVLGAGLTATALLQLGPLNINATVNYLYDFMEYYTSAEDDGSDFLPGSSVAIGVGLGLKI